MMLDKQLGESVSMHCEMYSLILHYKTCKTISNIFIDGCLKDNIIYGLPFKRYGISTYILNS